MKLHRCSYITLLNLQHIHLELANFAKWSPPTAWFFSRRDYRYLFGKKNQAVGD